MPRLTDRQIAWWEAQPVEQLCVDCGKAGSKAYVQPQESLNGKALCTDCIVRRNAKRKEDRKAEFAAMQRCEVPGCRRRGNWRVGAARVFLCGPHKERACGVFERHMSAVGGLALFLPAPAFSRDETLAMAQGRTA